MSRPLVPARACLPDHRATSSRILQAEGFAATRQPGATIGASFEITAKMPPPQYLFLSPADPASSGGPARVLNAAGRWARRAVRDPPAGVARDRGACRAGGGRARPPRAAAPSPCWRERMPTRSKAATSSCSTMPSRRRCCGPAAHSEAKARRLRTEAEKLDAFCMIVRAASAAPDQQAFAQVGRAASKALQAKFGGGSITSAFAWLAGPAGQAALERPPHRRHRAHGRAVDRADRRGRAARAAGEQLRENR